MLLTLLLSVSFFICKNILHSKNALFHRAFTTWFFVTSVSLFLHLSVLLTLRPTVLSFIQRSVPPCPGSSTALFHFSSVYLLLCFFILPSFGSSSATSRRLFVYIRLRPSSFFFFRCYFSSFFRLSVLSSFRIFTFPSLRSFVPVSLSRGFSFSPLQPHPLCKHL